MMTRTTQNRLPDLTRFQLLVKEDFLPKSGAEDVVPRHFQFNYALTMYNTWVVANLHGASKQGHNLSESKLYKAATYMAQICDDSSEMTEQEIGDVSRVSNILNEGNWF
jgi:hypothetical protein